MLRKAADCLTAADASAASPIEPSFRRAASLAAVHRGSHGYNAARYNAARCTVACCGCAQVSTTREENRKLRLEMQALLTVRRSAHAAAAVHRVAQQINQCDVFRFPRAARRCNTLRCRVRRT